MFGSEVIAPVAWELELLAVLNGFLKDFYTFCVWKADKLRIYYGFESFDKSFVHELVEEEQVIHTIIKCPFDAELNEVFFEIHEFIFLDKGYLRFNHPELCQVSRCIGVLSSESRTKGVNFSECHSS